MKKIMIAACMSLIFILQTTHCLLPNDSQALSYCKTHRKTHIAIVWPNAEGKDDKVERIFNKFGSIKFKKKIFFTYPEGYEVLRDAHQKVKNMEEHMNIYFSAESFRKPARIYLVSFDDLDTAVKCKYAIRHVYKMGYYSIHINDYHQEAIKLAELFFGDKAKRSINREESENSHSEISLLDLFTLYWHND